MKGEGARPGKVLLVKINTDEGITGMGDAGGVNNEVVINMIKSWAPFLIGANPLDRGVILEKAGRAIHSVWGMSYPAAVCSIDFALWDLAGKALNLPVYQLLGGKAVDKLVFNYFVTAEGLPTVKDRIKQAEKAVEGGVRSIGLKSLAFGGGGVHNAEADIENVGAIRKALGDKIQLSFDPNGGYCYAEALKLGKAMDEFHLFKYEQLVPWWDFDGLAALRQKLNTPICAHESSVLIPHLMQVIEKKAADIVGTKLASAGGITEGLKWASIAQASGLGMYCGAMNGPWEAAAQAHWLFSNAEFGKQDHDVFFPVIMYGTFDTTKPTDVDIFKIPQVYKDGYFYPPEGPGLGLELNEKALPKYITKGESIVTIGEKERKAGRGF
jgi:L-alanine-DL-glutamate epimerase-like enolase superfamily enzyme